MAAQNFTEIQWERPFGSAASELFHITQDGSNYDLTDKTVTFFARYQTNTITKTSDTVAELEITDAAGGDIEVKFTQVEVAAWEKKPYRFVIQVEDDATGKITIPILGLMTIVPVVEASA